MFFINHDAPEPITSDWMRSHMREVLDRVAMRQDRFLLYRRGRPVAGLVPPYEARALYELATKPARLRDVARELKALEERSLEDAVRDARDAFAREAPPAPSSRPSRRSSGASPETGPETGSETGPEMAEPGLDWDDLTEAQRARERKRREIAARLRG